MYHVILIKDWIDVKQSHQVNKKERKTRKYYKTFCLDSSSLDAGKFLSSICFLEFLLPHVTLLFIEEQQKLYKIFNLFL